ncbi:MAG TPA: metallophosphoesterase [Bacteroides sp.]|nr:metallophosphoesterase [Bacteroides sp.]
MMRTLILVMFAALLVTACTSKQAGQEEQSENGFTFVFLTDIHLKPEMKATEGFQMVIDTVNALAPDFVITGGDQIDDALYASYERADSLYGLYKTMAAGFKMPVYNTMGNHDIYGYSSLPKVSRDHPEFGERMFEQRVGKRYYSFDHKGWHFMIIDGIEQGDGTWGNYVGMVDAEQLEWIRQDLAGIDKETPVVISTHIPLVSIRPQINNGPLYAENHSALVINSTDVLAPFRQKNLKLVLQGHLHFLEELNLLNRVRFITGGAVCGSWWQTPDDAVLQEGFVLVKVTDNDFTWEYIDYGWETGIKSN